MKKIMLMLVMVVCTLGAFSQRAKKPNPYQVGVGAGLYPGLDAPYAITAKFYMKSGNSMEFYGYNLERSYRLTALFTPYLPVNRQGNLRVVVGPGVHVGLWKEKYKTNTYTKNPIIGGDGILGMEYTLPKLPLSFQFHFQPSVDIAGNNEYFYGKEWAGGIVRFVF